jgi:hypothetical protein
MDRSKKLHKTAIELEYKETEKLFVDEMVNNLSHEISVHEQEYNQLPKHSFVFQLASKFFGNNKDGGMSKADLARLMQSVKQHQHDMLQKQKALEGVIAHLNSKMQSAMLRMWGDIINLLSRASSWSKEEEQEVGSYFRAHTPPDRPSAAKDLREGDHVYCPRPGGYTHHGVCVKDDKGGNIYVIHFNGDIHTGGAWAITKLKQAFHPSPSLPPQPPAPLSSPVPGSSVAYVMTASIDEFASGCPIYVAKYKYQAPADVVQARAKRALWSGGFNVIERNCEHFATWCKTGVGVSLQVEDALRQRMYKVSEFLSKFDHTSGTSLQEKQNWCNKMAKLPLPILKQLADFAEHQANRLPTSVSFLPSQ